MPVSYPHTTHWDIYRYSSASQLRSHNKDWSVLDVQQASSRFHVNETKCMLDTAKDYHSQVQGTQRHIRLDQPQQSAVAEPAWRQVIMLTAVAPHYQTEHEDTQTVSWDAAEHYQLYHSQWLHIQVGLVYGNRHVHQDTGTSTVWDSAHRPSLAQLTNNHETKVRVGRPVHIWPGLTSEVFTFPNDVNRDGSENTGLLTIQPLEMVASLRKIYWFQSTYKLQKLDTNQVYSQHEQKWFETDNFPGPFLKAVALRSFLGNLLLKVSSVPFLHNEHTFQLENLKPWTLRYQDPPQCWSKHKTITRCQIRRPQPVRVPRSQVQF